MARLSTAATPFEHSTQAGSRCADQERVWNLVWWRRIVVFHHRRGDLAAVRTALHDRSDAGGVLAVPSNGLSAAIGLLATFLPASRSPWVEFYQLRPVQLFMLAVVIAALLFASGRAAAGDRRAHAGVVGCRRRAARRHEVTPEPSAGRLGVSTAIAPRVPQLIRSRLHRKYFRFFRCRVPGRVLFVHRRHGSTARLFAAASAAGDTCRDREAGPVPWDGQPRTLRLPSRELCLQTGLQLLKGQRYRVEIVLPDNEAVEARDQWRDKSIPVKSPAGFSSGDGSLLFVMFLPFRRVLTAQWFVPMVRIGNTSPNTTGSISLRRSRRRRQARPALRASDR